MRGILVQICSLSFKNGPRNGPVNILCMQLSIRIFVKDRILSAWIFRRQLSRIIIQSANTTPTVKTVCRALSQNDINSKYICDPLSRNTFLCCPSPKGNENYINPQDAGDEVKIMSV